MFLFVMITRRKFLSTAVAGSGIVAVGGLKTLMEAATTQTDNRGGTFSLGGDLTVNRMGFGAMRLTGEGIWGWPPDRESAKKVLKRALELGVNLIDTADAYGPETRSAIARWEADHGMNADGRIDQETLHAMGIRYS